MRRKSYLLTARAAADLREARAWLRARWGKGLTDAYFEDLHECAQCIAEDHASLPDRHELADGTALLLFPVREHCIVYEPLAPRLIAIVAVIRQSDQLVPGFRSHWFQFWFHLSRVGKGSGGRTSAHIRGPQGQLVVDLQLIGPPPLARAQRQDD